LSSPGVAQERYAAVEEVVVTAQKRPQTLSEVPISLAALDSELLENTGIDDFTMAADFIPNFSFLQGFDRSEVAVNIRGLTSGTSNPGIDPSVGFFLDGVYIARAAALTGKLLSVDRIEVLRGPQGTLYGRNTSAGAVNIYTKEPADGLEGEIKAGFGNYGEYTVSGSLSSPFADQAGGFLLSAFYTEGDTWLDNAATGDPLGKREDFGLFGKLVYDATDLLSLQFTFDYSENTTTAANVVGAFQKNQADIGTVFSTVGMLYRQSLMTGNPALARAGDALSRNVRFVQDVPVDTFDREVGRSDEPQADDLEQLGFAVELNYDLPFGTLTSISSWRESEDFASIDPDLSPIDLFLTSVRNEDEQFSQELRLASTGDGRFNYLLGLYYFDSEFTVDTQTAFGVPLFGRFNALMPPNPITTPQKANSVTSQETQASALFGQLSWDLTDTVTITYGFRFNDEEKSSVINQDPDRGLNPTSRIPFPLQFPVLVGLESEVSDEDFISTLNLNWEFGQASNIYVTYAEGLKSGGINASILLNTNSLTFEKETSTNFEVGFRSRLDSGLRLSAAVFFTDFDDLQIQTFDPTNPANILVTNAGAAEIRGVEADMFYPFSDAFEVNAAVAYNSSEYKDTRFPGGFRLGQIPQLPGVTLQLPFDAMRMLVLREASGQTLSRAPEWSASIGAQFNFDLTANISGALRADYSYSGGQFLDAILSPQSEIDSYSVVNVRAILFTADEAWRVSIYANNVLDEDYYTQLIASPGAAGLGVNPMVPTWMGVQGLPRTFGVEVSRRFGGS